MKKRLIALFLMIGVAALFSTAWSESIVPVINEDEIQEDLPMMKIEIGNAVLYAELADTDAASELHEKLAVGSIMVDVSNYGGWEKVGDLPWYLSANDEQLTAQPGDIMLYAGHSIVLFYGNNSWAYTRLGRIIEIDADGLCEVLSANESRLTLSLAE